MSVYVYPLNFTEISSNVYQLCVLRNEEVASMEQED